MSQQESLETWMATHSQACKTIENKMREEVDAALRQAYNETGDAVRRALEGAHERQSTEMQRKFDNLQDTLREAGISHYNCSRQSLQDKDLEITQLREEYETKLKAKDEEIAALKESINGLRGSCQDKDAIVTLAMDTNKRQLEEQDQKKNAKRHHQNKKAKLEQQLQANQEIEVVKREPSRLLKKVEEYSRSFDTLQKAVKELSDSNRQLVEAQNQLEAIGKRMESNDISAMLYKLS